MLDPPNLDEQKLITTLENRFGILSSTLTYLPLGYDAASWVYRVETKQGGPYFLKLRSANSFSPASMAIPDYLYHQGVSHILAPVHTADHALWVEVGDFVLSLYPFIQGQSAVDTGFSQRSWRAFGALMGQIHSCRLPPELKRLVPQEAFIPSRRNLIEKISREAQGSAKAPPEAEKLYKFWINHETTIQEVVQRADTLASRLRGRPHQFALCHADMHGWNILVDEGGQFWLIDWDEVIFACKERDLMFAFGGIGGDGVGAQQSTWFLDGYGDQSIDSEALAYYRYAWAVQDIAACAELVLYAPDRSQESRRAALASLRNLFKPGEIVEIACSSA